MNELVSIIIPVYNLEGYIEKCLDSALNQTYKNIEVILIDDGSVDRSGEICDYYKNKDKRVKVIHKENSGLVAARKFGLEISRGEYVLPLDADDWIEPDMVETMVTFMKENDIDFAQCGLVWEYTDGRKTQNEDILPERIYDLSDLNCLLYKNLFVGFGIGTKDGVRLNICSCIFKREILFRSQMAVPDGLHNGEDDACFFIAILQSRRFYMCNRPFYHSSVRRKSMSRSHEMFFVEQVFMIEKCVRPVIENHVFASCLVPRFNKYLLKLFNTYFKRTWGVGYHPLYVFESKNVPNQSRIIIYGAGAVGQAYYYQMKNKFDIVAWVDQKRKSVDSIPIQCIEDIQQLHYDFIILSALKEGTATNMREQLIDLNVPANKIIWEKPIISEGEYYIIDKS